MQRIASSGAIANLPTPASVPGQSPGYFNQIGAGNPNPTVVSADWCNSVQEEIANVCTALGVPLSVTDTQQMLKAIKGLISASSRVKLTGNLTLYVNPAIGNDTVNTGVSPSTPFATMQAAYNAMMHNYDPVGFAGIIQLAATSHTQGLIANQPLGFWSSITVQGTPGSPSSTIINVSNGNCVIATQGAIIGVNGVKLTTTGTSGNYSTSGVGLLTYLSGLIIFQNVEFGTCGSAHINTSSGGFINIPSTSQGSVTYSITGSAPYHLLCNALSEASMRGAAVTISNTPAFSASFCTVSQNALVDWTGTTFTGSATGTRYSVTTNSTISGTGAVSTFLPGSVNGSTATNGQYT